MLNLSTTLRLEGTADKCRMTMSMQHFAFIVPSESTTIYLSRRADFSRHTEKLVLKDTKLFIFFSYRFQSLMQLKYPDQ